MHDCLRARSSFMLHYVVATYICAAFRHTMVLCRYFTVPFLMVLLHMKPPTRAQAGFTAGVFVLADAVVLYVFLLRPFKWHDGSIARFMF